MRFIKKAIAALLTATLLVTMLAGCQSSSVLDFNELYTSLANANLFEGSNMTKMGQQALDNFYYIDEADLKDGNYLIYFAETSTGKADEVAMFEASDESKVVTIQSLIQDRINDLKIRFESYAPDEMPKLENAVVKTKGNYVVMVICQDYEKAAKIVDEALQ